jgi:hypothetical protein
MIYEGRNYSFSLLNFRPFPRLLEDEGRILPCVHLGQLGGYFRAETGHLNSAVHIWAFEDIEDRERRRSAMWSDPEWLAYSTKVLSWIARMENRLLKPTGFSPLC